MQLLQNHLDGLRSDDVSLGFNIPSLGVGPSGCDGCATVGSESSKAFRSVSFEKMDCRYNTSLPP